MIPFQVLFEELGLPAFELPDQIAKLYGGSLGFKEPCVFANFVTSLDGVAAIPLQERSSRLISGGSEADRFLMGLLRACADAVLIGAGTLRAHPKSTWTSGQGLPAHTPEYAELRRRIGRTGEAPRLVVVSASGEIPAHPAFDGDAWVLTTRAGAARLQGRLPGGARVIPLGEGPMLDASRIAATLRGEGCELILTEGGPSLLGHLVEAGVVDELFLSLSPILAGRTERGYRPGLLDQVEMLPDRTLQAVLQSVRMHESFLFLRYSLKPPRSGHFGKATSASA
jgi:riboflavin biosynthesis pyrimidine reductase